jgi:hypothetical protein
MNEKLKVVRSPEPRVEAAREAEQGRRVAEIAREIEELGHALEVRDRLTRSDTGEGAKGSPAQAGQTTGPFSLIFGRALMLTGRAIEMIQNAYGAGTCPQPGTRAAAGGTSDDQKLLAQERARNRELEQQLSVRADEQKLLAQERARNRELKQQLAARGNEQKLLAQERARSCHLEQQSSIRQEDQKLLAQERTRNQKLEEQLAARRDNQKLLAQERARNPAPELQLVVRRDAVRDRDRTGTASPSSRPASRQAPPAPDRPTTTLPPASDKPVIPASHKSRKLTARPTAPVAPGNLEVVHLMAEARLLLDQGNIIAARRVLERAAESGTVEALFLLAETYDRAILSAWGISGRRGSVTKAHGNSMPRLSPAAFTRRSID